VDAITHRLRRLRSWFLALFAIQSILAVAITADILGTMTIVGAHGAAVGHLSEAYILSWTVGVRAALQGVPLRLPVARGSAPLATLC